MGAPSGKTRPFGHYPEDVLLRTQGAHTRHPFILWTRKKLLIAICTPLGQQLLLLMLPYQVV